MTRGALASGCASLSAGSSLSPSASISAATSSAGSASLGLFGPRAAARGHGHPPKGHAQGHEQRAHQHRVREVFGHALTSGAELVDAGQAVEEGLVPFDDGLVGRGEEVGEKAQLVQQAEGLAGRALPEDLVELLEHAGGAAADDVAARGADGLHRLAGRW